MFSPRIALAGALSGAAALALATMLALPASAATTSQTTCFEAKQAYATAQNALAVATQADRVEDSTVSGAVDSVADKADTDKAAAASAVAVALQNMNALCGTSTTPGPVGLPHPHPWPTPTPGPVGLPRDLNCTQLAARGIHDIPASSVWYRPALDANNDGIGCETNLNTFRVVNGQKCHLVDGEWVPVTVVTVPAPCTSCAASVTAPPPVIYQQPVTVPGPVIQGQPTYVPGPVVSVPNTSQGVNNGDGSTDIAITVDLGNILIGNILS